MTSPSELTHKRHLEAVDPVGVEAAPAEVSLPDEQPLAAGPHPHHRWNQGGIEHSVDRRGLNEHPQQLVLRGSYLEFQARMRRSN